MKSNSYIEIDLDILKINASNIINKYPDYKYKIAMIKGDAYGHGYYIVNTLKEVGFNYFAVSNLNDAIKIRKYDKDTSILCCEPIDLKYIDDIIKYNITLTIYSVSYLESLIKLNKKVKIHILIDSGLNRLGINNKDDFDKCCSIINDNIYLEGVYSHFGTTGVNDNRWDNQLDSFKNIVSSIDLNSIDIVHLYSSFSLVNHPKIDICNGYRVGSLIFGVNTSLKYSSGFKDKLRLLRNDYFKKKYNLSDVYYNSNIDVKTFMRVYSKVIEIKSIKGNEYVGYGLEYKTNKDIKIGIVDIGYESGIGRRNNNRKVLINNNYYNIIGEVSMCMIIIEIDDSVKINDRVLIVGDTIPLSTICNSKNESIQETFISLGKSLNRIYIKNNKVIFEEEK